jgi:hypothetical protein
LAWDGKGLVLDLTQVPDEILEDLIQWRNEKVDRENDEFKKYRT